MTGEYSDCYDEYVFQEGLDLTPLERASTWLTADDPQEVGQIDYRYVKEGHPSSITYEQLRLLQRTNRIVPLILPGL